MSDTGNAIALLFTWFLLILFLLGGFRTAMTLGGKKAANTFSPSGEDLKGFGRRLTRVHANNYENLPFFLAILLYAQFSAQSTVTDSLALVLVAARVAQGVVHLASVSVPAVMVRFAFFLLQIGIIACWVVRLFFA